MEDTKVCPFCGEQILSVAIKCKHCGSNLNGAAAPQPNQPTAVPIQARAKFRFNNFMKGAFACWIGGSLLILGGFVKVMGGISHGGVDSNAIIMMVLGVVALAVGGTLNKLGKSRELASLGQDRK